ncbi:MAG: SGNH/GDSL hydrolase family protein [Nitrospirae bacterium]|nr:MAG: SGNH/GDSL hydrolase family protein [Nitrospirota bacterium]
MKVKELVKNVFILLLPAFVVTIIFLELVFRFVIPANQSPYYIFDTKDNLMKMSTEPFSDGVSTLGPLAQVRARWHINNEGWNSNFDYKENHDKPVIALFGASLIEATIVDVNQSVSAKLHEMLHGEYYSYSFGIAGATLSNMLHTSRYAVKKFSPDVLVFNVTPGLILPSSCADNGFPGFMCLEPRGDEFSETVKPYIPKSAYRLIRKSAVVRYLYHNIGVQKLVLRFLYAEKKETPRNVIDNDSARIRIKKERILDYILKSIKNENKDKVVVMYSNSGEGVEGYSDDEFDMVKESCHKYGIHFVNLGKELSDIEKKYGKKVDFGFDAHWNAFGHESVAKIIYGELKKMNIIRGLK